jgi:hypothetical protein
LLLNWAEVETYKVKNKEEVKKLMETYLSENAADAGAWLTYIKFVRFFDDIKLIRTLCKRGLEYSDDFETLAGAWLEWEKKFGTIDTMFDCMTKIQKKRAKALALALEQREAMQDVSPNPDSDPAASKRHRRPGPDDSAYPAKRLKAEEEDGKNEPPPLAQRSTLFINNLPDEVVEDELEEHFKTVEISPTA